MYRICVECRHWYLSTLYWIGLEWYLRYIIFVSGLEKGYYVIGRPIRLKLVTRNCIYVKFIGQKINDDTGNESRKFWCNNLCAHFSLPLYAHAYARTTTWSNTGMQTQVWFSEVLFVSNYHTHSPYHNKVSYSLTWHKI